MTRATSVSIGPLSQRSKSNGHFAPAPADFQPPSKHCNASMGGRYTGPAWNLRPGAETHKQFKSKGPI